MQLKQNDIKYVFGCYTLLIVNCMSNNINIYALSSCFYLKREIKAIRQGANNIRNVQFQVYWTRLGNEREGENDHDIV